MSALPLAKPENISNLLTPDQQYAAPAIVADNNRAAYIWLGEDGSERIVTHGQLYRLVCRFANGLKSLGVVKGDRVVIYMPLAIEGARDTSTMEG